MRTIIKAVKANITEAENVEVIVNATNSTLKGSKGVTGSIHKAAGPDLLKECKLIGGCSTGDAVITGAYQLPYKAIIHTVGPIWKGGKNGEAFLLKNCYIRTLELAKENNLRSIAFPSIATGTYKYPLNEAAEIAVKTVVDFCQEHPDSFDYICWTLLVDSTRAVYENEISKYVNQSQDSSELKRDMLTLEYQISVSDKNLLTGPLSEKVVEQEIPHFDYDDIINVEFSEDVPKADRWDYTAAAVSGLLSGTLSILWSKSIDLENAHEWGTEKLGKIVIEVAKSQGFNKDDLQLAIRFLENKFPMSADAAMAQLGGALQHHLRDFTHHPTLVGLVFSILSQFTGCAFGTDTDGKFIKIVLPEHAVIGESFGEKILYGTVYWFYHLISDVDGSSFSPGGGTGLPGPLLSFLKEISALPICEEIKMNYKDGEISFSQWISKLFNGTYYRNEEGKPIRFDLRTEIGIDAQLLEQTKPVIINECIVRALYFARRLTWEISNKKVRSLLDLGKLDPKNFLPFKNRALTRMITVSTGVFVLINTSGTAVKSAIKSHGNQGVMVTDFLLSLNYVGIVRFGIACTADAKYIGEDVRNSFIKYQQYKQRIQAEKNKQIFSEYKFLSLDENKIRLLYSLEYQMIRYDISETQNLKTLEAKLLWLNEWEKIIAKGLSSEPDKVFIKDKRHLYSQLREEEENTLDNVWIYLLGLELSLFEGYVPLNCNNDNKFKGLKVSSDYISDVFCEKQNYLDKADFTRLSKLVLHYKARVSGKTQKALISAAGTMMIAAATGGLALAFAPEIAVLIAGESFAGLYGAALTNASLAFVGGGSLAAGGLGMAGGTAILTGGGTLIGLCSSGTVSMVTVLSSVPEEFILNECAKLLTICKVMKSESLVNWLKNIQHSKNQIDNMVSEVEHDIELANLQTKDKDRLLIKKMQTGYRYLKRTSLEIDKILDQ